MYKKGKGRMFPGTALRNAKMVDPCVCLYSPLKVEVMGDLPISI